MPNSADSLSRITLVYRDDSGDQHTQPLIDLTYVGILIDQETGDDMELIDARVSPGHPILVDNERYQGIVDVIDAVKTDERSLDTDEYAGRILDVLSAAESEHRIRPVISLDADSVRAELREAAGSHDLTEKQANRIAGRCDDEIHRAIRAEAHDAFWAQCGDVRQRAITRLVHDRLGCVVHLDGDTTSGVDEANNH